jgi:release factor glutamine methyltransferase
MTVRELIQQSRIDRVEAEILLADILEVERAWLFAHGEDLVAEPALTLFANHAQARQDGEPLAYLLGYRDFRSLRLGVNRHVLIPRRETEHLVEWAIECVDAGARQVLDLGTGSGAIALACKSERPEAMVTAIDCSVEALACAKANARSLGVQVEWFESNWFERLGVAQWDLVVSNPPYISASDAHLEQGDLPAEPDGALIGGQSGFESIEHIVEQTPDYLVSGGWLLLEHGFDQADAVAARMQDRGFRQVSSRRDWSGQPRMTGGQWPH